MILVTIKTTLRTSFDIDLYFKALCKTLEGIGHFLHKRASEDSGEDNLLPPF